MTPNKTLHTNRRPALGFGLSIWFFDAARRHHVIVWAAVGELGRSAKKDHFPIYHYEQSQHQN